MLIDIHNHIDFYKDEEIKAIVERARKNKVGIILINGVKPKNNRRILELTKKYKEVKASWGLYPIDALSMQDKDIDNEISFLKINKDNIIAVGEVGLDYKEDEKEHEKQKEILRKIIKTAIELDKPLIIHSRKAEKDTIELLKKMKAKKVIMHCFNGNLKLVEKIIENKWYLTIPTNVVFAEHFQKVISQCPIEQLFCETDSPYLHPRKERNNEPANIIESYKKIAEIKNLPVEEVEKKIEENYKQLF
jgi:TatD DNase family protein